MVGRVEQVADQHDDHQHEQGEQGATDPARAAGEAAHGRGQGHPLTVGSAPADGDAALSGCIRCMSDSLIAQTVSVRSDAGDDIEAYLARPLESTDRGGVVVIHHMPGYDRGSKEITRRFAELGYDAICPNLYWRDAPGASPDDAAAAGRANGGVPDERLIADVAGAAAHLRALPENNGKIGVIGYCSGGRQSVLAATAVDVQAAVDCYGAFVVGTPPEGFPLQVANLVDRLPDLRAPLLGLFGLEDSYPSPAQVTELDEILTGLGKAHDFTSYPDTGHGFFSTDRPAYRVDSAVDGWERITAFYGEHLS